MRARILGIQFNRTPQGCHSAVKVTIQQQTLAQFIKHIAISWIEFRGPPQMNYCRFPVPGFQQTAAELVLHLRTVWRAFDLEFVLGESLLVLPQAGIGKSQMVMPQRDAGIDSQGRAKLLDSLQGTVGVLIASS